MRLYRVVALAMGCFFACAGAYADQIEASTALDEEVAAPRWAVEFKAGQFEPEIPEWSRYYDENRGIQTALTVFRAMGPVFEIVADAAHFHDRGEGSLPLNVQTGGDMLYELYSLALGATIRTPRPIGGWFTPYVGGSWARVYYSTTINSHDRRRGGADGVLLRGGVRVLLDPFDTLGARTLQKQFGIDGSWLTLEYQKLETDTVSGYDLGGRAWFAGLRFEF